MDPRLGWYQLDQEGPALDSWTKLSTMAALSVKDNQDFIPINNNSELNSLTNNNNNNNNDSTSSISNNSTTSTNNANLFNLTRKGSNNNLLPQATNKRPRREIMTAKHYEQLQDFIPWKKQDNYTGICG